MFNLPIFNIILHSVCYDIAWFCAILSAQTKPIWLGPSLVIGLTSLQILWQIKIMRRSNGLMTMIGIFLSIGFIFDSILVYSGTMTFKNALHSQLTSPFLLAIWFNFAVLFYSVLMFLKDKYIWLAVLSFLGFPLAYFSGSYFGAARMEHGWMSLLIVGMMYAFAMPLALFIYNKRMKTHA